MLCYETAACHLLVHVDGKALRPDCGPRRVLDLAIGSELFTPLKGF